MKHFVCYLCVCAILNLLCFPINCLHSTSFSTLLQLSLILSELDPKPTEITGGALLAEVDLPLGMEIKTKKSCIQRPLEVQTGFPNNYIHF